MPVYTHRPMCSTKVPKVRRFTGAIVKAGSMVSLAVGTRWLLSWIVCLLRCCPSRACLLIPRLLRGTRHGTSAHGCKGHDAPHRDLRPRTPSYRTEHLLATTWD